MHEYRLAPGTLAAVLGVTIVAQFLRVIAIWLCGEAVARLSPVVYIILGPLLFLVQMVPFTLNGLGLREAFFVVFLGRFGVPEDVAFAAGFLFYAVSVATAVRARSSSSGGASDRRRRPADQVLTQPPQGRRLGGPRTARRWGRRWTTGRCCSASTSRTGTSSCSSVPGWPGWDSRTRPSCARWMPSSASWTRSTLRRRSSSSA